MAVINTYAQKRRKKKEKNNKSFESSTVYGIKPVSALRILKCPSAGEGGKSV